jgi:tRNA (guanine-N7-)-methyltransferase
MSYESHHVSLVDGRKLPFHRPLPPRESLSLSSFIPENFSKIEVEIGSGTGRFISKRARLYPERFFIGIDKKKDRIHSTSGKLERGTKESSVENWKLLHCDARIFLHQEIPALDVLHVYHPDPWPKKRHHKHRFFRSPDARHWSDAIKKGGELRISTDQADYFEEILAIVQGWNIFDFNLAYVKRSGVAQSRFEEIFLNQNLPVFKAYFRKK